MRTWATRSTTAPVEIMRREARAAVKELASPDTDPTDRRKLAEHFAIYASEGKLKDPAFRRCVQDDFYRRVDEIIDPLGRGEAKGSAGAVLSASNVVTQLVANYAAREQLENEPDSLPDAIWYDARTLIHCAEVMYQANQPTLAADPQRGHAFRPLDVRTLRDRACSHLLMLLGVATTGPITGPHPTRHDLNRRLASWVNATGDDRARAVK